MTILIFQLVVLLFSAVIHEVSHGLAAERLGDPTAKLAGRLTLNPTKHLDPFGSVILPVMLYLISGGSFVFGWAKPVPYNPYHLKNPERDGGIIAAAGPLSNLLIASVFAVLFKIGTITLPIGGPVLISILPLFNIIILINIVLAVFNLVPLPPLDGSKVLFAFLHPSNKVRLFLERYGMILLMTFIFFGFRLITPIIYSIYNLLI